MSIFMLRCNIKHLAAAFFEPATNWPDQFNGWIQKAFSPALDFLAAKCHMFAARD